MSVAPTVKRKTAAENEAGEGKRLRTNQDIDQVEAGEGKRLRTNQDIDQVEDLVEWARRHGARSDAFSFQYKAPTLEADPYKATRAAFTTRCIPANSEIGFIPSCLVLSETTAHASPFGTRFSDYLNSHKEDAALLSQSGRDPYAPGLIFLSAYLVCERFEKRATSFWAPYLYSLPARYSIPLWWEEGQVEVAFQGTNLKHVVEERRKLLKVGLDVVKRACGDLFESGSLTWDHLLWAYSAISSRAFPRAKVKTPTDGRDHAAEGAVEVAGEASELCLYPVLDMLNHRRGERVEWRINENREDGGVTFIAMDDVPEGVEIFNNYGAKGNENLLANYGFVLDPNPEDYVKVSLQIRDASDPLASRKRALLPRLRPNRLLYLLFAGDDDTSIPPDLLAVMRVLLMNKVELERFEKDLSRTPVDESADAPRQPLSARNEVAVLTVLHELLSRKLAE
ncbi:hypothetical protein HK104_005969, partial [Borealophlyctis nickersoniae]